MKKVFLSVLLLCPVFFLQAQTVTSARFFIDNSRDSFRYIELLLDNDVMVVIDDSGQIEQMESTRSGRRNSIDRPDFRVSYYDRFDMHDPTGRIKSIGNLQFTYYNKFDIHDKFGLLKSIGDINIEYYNTFDINDPKGKVKLVGPVKIEYFNKFDRDEDFGRIKSIQGNTSRVSVMGKINNNNNWRRGRNDRY